MVAIMEPLDQTDVEKQSNEIKEEKLEENIDGGVDSLIQNKIKTETRICGTNFLNQSQDRPT